MEVGCSGIDLVTRFKAFKSSNMTSQEDVTLMSHDGKENPTLTPTPSTLLKTQKRKAMDVETQDNVTLENKDDQAPPLPLAVTTKPQYLSSQMKPTKLSNLKVSQKPPESLNLTANPSKKNLEKPLQSGEKEIDKTEMINTEMKT